MLASMFISGANNELYGDLKTELNNDFIKGVDNWPVDVDGAVQPMNAYMAKKMTWSKITMDSSEVAFAQKETKSAIVCH